MTPIAKVLNEAQKFGRKPFLLSRGERQTIQTDFNRHFGEDASEADETEVYNWVRNTEALWDRIQYVLTRRLDAMYRHDPKSLRSDYSWGLDFNPFYVSVCHVSDLLRGFIQHGAKSFPLR